MNSKIYSVISSVIFLFFSSQVARSFENPESCSVSKVCSGGQTVRCEANGAGAHCNVHQRGVSCSYYDDGRLVEINRSCGFGSNVSLEESGSDFLEAQVQKLVPGVSDAESIIHRPDGYYDVKCNDGTREVVDRDALDAGDICKTGMSSGRYQVRCEGHGNIYFPTRSKDNRRLGSSVTSSQCNAIAETAVNQVVCSASSPHIFFVTRISDMQHLGNSTSLDDCLPSAGYNRQGLTCVPMAGAWRLMKVNSQQSLGFNVTQRECFASLRATREGVTCVNLGGAKWAIERVVDETRLGHFSSHRDCVTATDNAFQKRVCTNAGINRWVVTDIATGRAESSYMTLETCITNL